VHGQEQTQLRAGACLQLPNKGMETPTKLLTAPSHFPLAQPCDLRCHSSTMPETTVSSGSKTLTRVEEVAEFLHLVQGLNSH